MKRLLYIFLVFLTLPPLAALFAQQTDAQSTDKAWVMTQQGIATQEMRGVGLYAAHPRLAVGSKVRVANTRNDKEVEVTITRNIPPRADRVIDLSPDAARAIDLGFVDYVLIYSKSPALSAPPAVFSQRGIATQEMQYDGLAAVHPNLKIGTRARVVNWANGKEIVVTIIGNEEPRADRVIDLSPDAARALDLGSPGPVIITLVLPRSDSE